ncbi:glutamine-hydrolyzing GMP synthase [Polyangium jinanense]|uniref:GMP synthase [glutamine-hydrolyzing] n=1 Tax=Polyangium jinanense TaxID=2829994 RepID=A0A9X3XC95_9BACT|nr:glutamine-hydrolyzing GMP synthase [Polyangium jinanense]MDC3958743.1 glutamine-hydrolyzing GMP synthase [Polyangium jinanense]MDC3985276.1 glutamine-hydrolyzing GMP synthase [Polyangium jinanense]
MLTGRRDLVLILDFGSQYTQLIARRIREASVYCEVYRYDLPIERIRELAPRGIILSGGPSSVYGEGAPHISAELFSVGIPILGICYGMQLLSHLLGGKVERGTEGEYGPALVRTTRAAGVFSRFNDGDVLDVWMSHGDKVVELPPGFSTLGTTDTTPFAAIADDERHIYGLQFHPEVAHTRRGKDLLEAFLFDVCGLEPTWTPASFVEESVEVIRQKVGPAASAVCGLSGGVDSSVAAILCHRALGDRLVCIFVDNGLLRKGEAEQVVKMFGDHYHLRLVHVDARARFLDALSGVTDPEQKRKTIGRVFIEVFEEEAKKIEDCRFLVQGTLYPDVIESVSAKGPSAVIKSHHNVGGLPERMKLGLVEPLRELFKDEVRAVGATMGIPHHLLWRHPFPGPGLAVRCLGTLTEERLHVLREADAIFEEEIREAGLYDKIWQSFCVLLPVRTVGVMGDERTYDEVIALRAVESKDGMTADWARIPHEVLGRTSARIINEVRGVNRVVYDVSSKPPATIEWE